MLNPWQDLVIRKAEGEDQAALDHLLRRNSFIHRHLGWESPLFWLGQAPFYLLQSEYGVAAALAFPPDEDQITWLRLFAVRSGYPVAHAWKMLWDAALSWTKMNNPGLLVNSLVMNQEMKKLLDGAGFQEVCRVVPLVWDAGRALWPREDTDLLVRDMTSEDLRQVYEIDLGAFDLIWRNSMSQLQAAFQEASSARVIEREGKIAAYQISTTNPRGAHLARLAVDPKFQNQGLATRLLRDMLGGFQDAGMVEITVNTQSDNYKSLELYRKFGFLEMDESYPVLQYKC